MNEETKLPTAQDAVAEDDKGRCAPARGSGVLLLVWVFCFCSVSNYIVAHDNPDYLNLVQVGNMQMLAFGLFAHLAKWLWRPR